MSSPLIGFIGILILMAMVVVGIPISFSLIAMGFAGVLLICGAGPALTNMAVVPFGLTNDHTFAIIPLFLLMSAFIANSGIGEEAYDTARAWVGHIRGGLAMATVAACGLFAATSGSSMACAMAMGKVAYPEMKRLKYDSGLSAGCIAAGGSLGILIPPSLGFVVIGILTEVSIGKLFIAGIIPGILEILFYFVTIYILCRINPMLGPSIPSLPLREKVKSFQYTWPVGLLFLLVMGGIYAGAFTPAEAGGIGAFGALAVGLMRGKLSRAVFIGSVKETVVMTGTILLLLIGAFTFMRFLAVSRIPFVLSEYIATLEVSRYIILIIILLAYTLLGMFFDVMGIITLTIPIIFPTIVALDFDLIWFGVILVRVAEVGFISPPFGLNLFGLLGVIDLPAETLYRGVIPFIIADVFHIALLLAVPWLSLFLPNMM
jgi:tripartite ATP-independent transporter DctM subunit